MSHSLQNKQDKLTAGTGISITDNTIACTVKAPSDYVKKDNGSLAIGSFAIAQVADGKSVNNNSTISGASLLGLYFREYYYNPTNDGSSTTYSYSKGSALSGTWKNVSGINLASTSSVRSHTYVSGIFQRTS